MRIYIVRHGRPEGADRGTRFLGITDEPLSEEGKRQAEKLGARLFAAIGAKQPETAEKKKTEVCTADQTGCEEVRVRIVSSPLIRCLDTARIIAGCFGSSSVETDIDLREIDMGIWDGKYHDEIKAEYPELYDIRGLDLWSSAIPGGESFADAGARFKAAFERQLQYTSEDETLIIVSHAGAIRAGLSLLTDIPFECWMKTKIDYACAIAAIIDDGRITEMDLG